MSEAKFDRIVLICNLDGSVYARCYTGSTFTDAKVSYGCIASLVADGAKMLAHVFQKEAA